MQINADGNETSADFDGAMVYAEGDFGAAPWSWLDTVAKEVPIDSKCKRLQFTFSRDSEEPLLTYGIGIVYNAPVEQGVS